MTRCVPIRDVRDTAKFAKTVEESKEPIVVTRNGYQAFIVMSTDEYDALRLEAEKAQMFARVALAESEIKHGEYDEASSLAQTD